MRSFLAGLALLMAACTAPATVAAPSSAPASASAAPPGSAAPSAPSTPSAAASSRAVPATVVLQEYPLPRGSGAHDVAPAVDGGVWYTAQLAGKLGWLDPATGRVREIALGPGSAPHGVIVGPDGAPWITDGGQNAIVRVDPKTDAVTRYPMPAGRNANLNTATFDRAGILWFTGQAGVYGRLDPKASNGAGEIRVFDAPGGAGPYGIATTPDGMVYFASLAGSYLGWIDVETGNAATFPPPTARQGTRRVWSDSAGRVWASEWDAGQVARFERAGTRWREWKLPGAAPMPYAVYVDERDLVWLSDFGANALVRFDPATETFASYPFSLPNANVRQLLGRAGEVWGAMSGQDRLVVARSR